MGRPLTIRPKIPSIVPVQRLIILMTTERCPVRLIPHANIIRLQAETSYDSHAG